MRILPIGMALMISKVDLDKEWIVDCQPEVDNARPLTDKCELADDAWLWEANKTIAINIINVDLRYIVCEIFMVYIL